MMDVYAPLDKALTEINRANLRRFGKLKMAPFDELHVIRQVETVFTESIQMVKKKLRKACEDEFWLYMEMAGYDYETALWIEDGRLPEEWITERMSEVDPVTRYRFLDEAERKKTRLMESMTIRDGRNLEIDRALRSWTRQIGWFGIYAMDSAAMEAMEESDAEKVRWNTAQDERVCEECGPRDGQIYPRSKAPDKPHHGCRCWLTPVR